MRNPAAAHANTLGTPKVGAPSSSASGNRSKNATATTAPALKPSTHCIREARRSASRPPVQVVQNAAPDSANSNIEYSGNQPRQEAQNPFIPKPRDSAVKPDAVSPYDDRQAPAGRPLES